MRVWTLHAAPRAGMVPATPGRAELIPERFAWGAALGGPLWLVGHRLWLSTVFLTLAYLAIALLIPAWLVPAVVAGQLLAGLTGHDLRRRRLERLGLALTAVVVARDHEAALARSLRLRPDLARGFAR